MRRSPNVSDAGDTVAGAGTPFATIDPRRIDAIPLMSAVIVKVAVLGPSPVTVPVAVSVQTSSGSIVPTHPEMSNPVTSDAFGPPTTADAFRIVMSAGN